MNELLNYITETLKGICSESYHDRNTAKNVTYPYLTYTVGTLASQDIWQEEVPVDVDIFDLGESYLALFELETKLKTTLARKRDVTENFGTIWKYNRATPIPTGQKGLLRRNISLQLTVDWRNL